MSDAFSQYNLQTPPTALSTAPSVSLDDSQKLVVASLLDLFAGHPSKRKLTLWKEDAVFHDPLTNAEGRKQYEAQWYGLRAAFSEIERLHLQITSAGNPIELDLKTRYKVKGLGSEQVIDSKIKVWTDGEGDAMRIARVEDRWGGEIKDGPVRNALRELNSKAVPMGVSVPASVEEEEQGKK